MTQRRTFNKQEKKNVYAKGNGHCAICGKKLSFRKLTVDHIISLAKGGTNHFDNLQPVCQDCNRFKSDLTPDEFLEKLWTVFFYNFKAIVKFKCKHLFFHKTKALLQKLRVK